MSERIETMRRRLIRRSLMLAEVSQADLARRIGVSRGMVSHVIAGRRTSRTVQTAIARACRVPFRELWER